jgi:ABC-type uncharacterized transport system substrate-binding protein
MMYGWSEFVDAGGLVSYGPNLRMTIRRSATLVDRTLKGAKPADLPIEQPTTFELVINAEVQRLEHSVHHHAEVVACGRIAVQVQRAGRL